MREGWTAGLKLKDGTKLDAPIVKVTSRGSVIKVDLEVAPKIVLPIELRPKAP